MPGASTQGERMATHQSQPTGILRWRIDAPSPVLALAAHAGHAMREELQPWLHASERTRRVEEDPRIDRLLEPFPVALWTEASRFEIDLNRPRHAAVYLGPETCWGIQLWRELPPSHVLERSRRGHDEAWAAIDRLVDDAVERFGFCVLLDFHSYCWRRERELERWWDDPGRPFFNLGTCGAHPRFRALNQALLDALRPIRWQRRPVTVGENETVRGGSIHRRQQRRHPGRVVVPSLEIKKVFMDEHSGDFYEPGWTRLAEQTTAAWYRVLEDLPALLPGLAQASPFA
jgi:N-formylglutamate deformylase